MGQDWTIPPYLTEKANIVRHILFTAVYALVFINLYAPFGVESWYSFTQLQLFFYSSFLILVGVLVIVISRILMYYRTKRHKIHLASYLGWVGAEILVMAFVYTLLLKFIVDDPRDIVAAFKQSVRVTALVLLIPYTFLWLYFAYRDKTRELARMAAGEEHPGPSSRMVPFRDEKGEMKFSLKSKDLVYLEAADNYVIIYYRDRDKLSRFMIRNTLKKILEENHSAELIRCHRSYAVNLEGVKIIRREKEGLHFEMDQPAGISIPVSKTYVGEVIKKFSGA